MKDIRKEARPDGGHGMQEIQEMLTEEIKEDKKAGTAEEPKKVAPSADAMRPDGLRRERACPWDVAFRGRRCVACGRRVTEAGGTGGAVMIRPADGHLPRLICATCAALMEPYGDGSRKASAADGARSSARTDAAIGTAWPFGGEGDGDAGEGAELRPLKSLTAPRPPEGSAWPDMDAGAQEARDRRRQEEALRAALEAPDGRPSGDPWGGVFRTGRAFGRDREDWTPRKIYGRLCRAVVGQEKAKKAVAVALYEHWQRNRAAISGGAALTKSGILLIGPSGCGKTLLAQTAAGVLGVPFAEVDATELSETGFKGADPSSAMERLLRAAGGIVPRAEEGILFIDEIDKLARQGDEPGAINGLAVQQALLKIIEGSRHAEVRMPGRGSGTAAMDTARVLVICGGAFAGKPGMPETALTPQGREEGAGRGRRIGFLTGDAGNGADAAGGGHTEAVSDADLVRYGIIPELAGRLQVRAAMDPLDRDALKRILAEPEGAPVKQYRAAFIREGIDFSCTEGALDAAARLAEEKGSGARGLRGIMDGLLMEAMFAAPDGRGLGKRRLVLTEDDVLGITRPEDHIELVTEEENEPEL